MKVVFFTPEETQIGSHFLTTTPSDNPLQLGVLDDLGSNDHYSIYSLATVFDSLPTAGNYSIEAKNSRDTEAFFSILIANFADAGVIVSRSDFIPTDAFGDVANTPELLSQPTLWLAVLIVVILILYRQLYESKRAAVLLLYGHSSLKTWFLVSGRMISITMCVLIFISTLAAVLVPGTTKNFVISSVSQLILISLVILLVSFITIPYVSFMNIQESLKNRKDTHALIIVNLIIKCALSLVLILLCTTGVYQLISVQDAASRIGNWQATSQYGVFYPMLAEDDSDHSIASDFPTYATIVYELYPKLNHGGALFIESDEFELSTFELYEKYPETRPPYSSFIVNPNYLKAYPVNDSMGKAVSISENEVDWVLLVPEKYRDEEDRVIQWYQPNRNGDDEIESAWETDLKVFGREATEDQRKQKVKIIYIADNQRIFSFNPNVAPEDGNCIVDPIIEVMTMGNSAGVDRFNCITGMPSSALKVKLTNNSTAQTLAEFDGFLKELHLDDNLPYLVTLDDYEIGNLQQLQQLLIATIVQIAVTFVIFLLIAIQAVTLMFEQNARRIAVRKLLGYGLISRHRSLFVVYIITWLILLIILLAMTLNAERFMVVPGLPSVAFFDFASVLASVSQVGFVTVFLIAIVFFIAETSISIGITRFVEGRRTAAVLKGEF